MSYYNTLNEYGNELIKSIKKSEKQEAVILQLFKDRLEWQPSQIYVALNHYYPITSVRRSLTNLTSEGYLIKTEKKSMGLYGKNEHVWRIKE
jgi:hypothetical protein